MNSSIRKVSEELQLLANKHKLEIEDELAYYYEIEAYEKIICYLNSQNISIGNYDLIRLIQHPEQFECDRVNVLYEIQLEVLRNPPSFFIHPDALYLFTIHRQLFWPDIDE